MDERFNAVRNGDSYNCPRCYRGHSLVQLRSPSLWQCGTDGVSGCFAVFRLELSRHSEYDTLVRVLSEPVARQTPEEFAARRARFHQ